MSNGTTVFSVTDYAYKATGDIDAPVTQEIEAAGSPQAVTLNFSYDDADNLLSEADELGRVTAFDYDADGDQIAEQDPSPNVAVPTDPNGGANNRTFNRQTANGPVTSAVYGPAGNVTAQIDAAGNETDNTYDLIGDLLSTTGPAPTSGAARPTMTYSYDHDGELVSETDPLGRVTTFDYNSFGELIERQGPSPDGIKPGPVTRYQYDGDGNLVASFDANGNETQYVYNDRNERIEEIDPAPGGTISYSYNAAQQLVQVVDAVGHVTQYQYGPDGNRTATIAPNLTTGLAGDASTTTSDDYDLAGDLISETTPNGATTTNQYDLLNQLTKTIQPAPSSGAAAPVTTYQYDPAGELTGTVNPLGLSQTEVYDGLGNVLDEVDFDGVTTANSYNLLSQLVSTEQEGGGQTANLATNTFDALGELLSDPEKGISPITDRLVDNE